MAETKFILVVQDGVVTGIVEMIMVNIIATGHRHENSINVQ